MENFLDIYIDDCRYVQRTPTSKILRYNEHGELIEKINNINVLTNKVLTELTIQEEILLDPSKSFEYKIVDNGISITKSHLPLNIENVIIPETIDGYNVVEIEKDVLKNCKPKNLYLPDTVEKIPEQFLGGFDSLERVHLSSKIEKIPNNCFYCCLNLKEINLDNVKSIGDFSFYNCVSLKNINLDDVTTIGVAAFQETNIENISLPKISFLDIEVFKGCTNLRKVSLSENLKAIPKRCFEYCVELTDFKIPNECIIIDSMAFQNCKGLSNIEFNNKLEVIENYACYNCDNLSKLYFPDSLKIIYRNAFRNCANLNFVNISNKTVLEHLVFGNVKFKKRNKLDKFIANIKNMQMIDDECR